MFPIKSDREWERNIEDSIERKRLLKDFRRRSNGQVAGPGRRRPKLEFRRLELRERTNKSSYFDLG